MSKANLLFELGVEEMPSAPLYRAADELRIKATEVFDDAGLTFGELMVEFTPRRLFLAVIDLDIEQEDSVLVSKGPALAIAKDAEGNFTKAAIGFARGKGLSPEDLIEREVEGVEYLFAEQKIKGKKTAELLPKLLKNLILSLSWPKAQRWGSEEVKFIRPLRWILALFGGEVVPVEFGSVVASNQSYGHRFLAPQGFVVETLEGYKQSLHEAFVVLSAAKRRQMIIAQVKELAAAHGEAILDEDVLNEVVNLCEYPNALLGSFEESFLSVPADILLSAMQKHQRYFAIRKADGELDNHFIVISNGDKAAGKTISHGHERVLRARLYDAHFFVEEDLQISLDVWREKLGTLVFQRDLGTMLDKTCRIEALAAYMVDVLGLKDEREEILRAASLCKADLVTNAVVEFTELQGSMGAHYAQKQGETPLVAKIIREHYHPRFAGDVVPSTTAARIVALADKIDTVVGILLVGKAPTGSSDPFAIRRNTISIISILKTEPKLNIFDITDYAAELYRKAGVWSDEAAGSWREFIIQRLIRMYREEGFRYDLVDATLANFKGSVVDTFLRLQALRSFIQAMPEDSENLFVALNRANNLRDESIGLEINEQILNGIEQSLIKAIREVSEVVKADLKSQEYEDLLEQLATLRKPVDEFFENLMVLDENEDIRRNRLAILNHLVGLFAQFADLTRVESSSG